MNHAPQSYVRIKRKKQTVFLHCDVNDTVASIKNRVHLILNVDVAKQRLLLGRQNLEDHSTLADNGVDKDSDTVLYLVQRLDDGSAGEEVWEEVDAALLGGSSPHVAPAQGAAPVGTSWDESNKNVVDKNKQWNN